MPRDDLEEGLPTGVTCRPATCPAASQCARGTYARGDLPVGVPGGGRAVLLSILFLLKINSVQSFRLEVLLNSSPHPTGTMSAA